jgi:hypothetical protein
MLRLLPQSHYQARLPRTLPSSCMQHMLLAQEDASSTFMFSVPLTCWAAYACSHTPDRRHTACDAHGCQGATGQGVAVLAHRAAGCPTNAREWLCVGGCARAAGAYQWGCPRIARRQHGTTYTTGDRHSVVSTSGRQPTLKGDTTARSK